MSIGLEPLTEREELLLLSQWKHLPRESLPSGTPLRTWPSKKTDVVVENGPDQPRPPHSPSHYFDFELLAALPFMKVVLDIVELELTMAVGIAVYLADALHLTLINGLLLGGRMPYNFAPCKWIAAISDFFNGVPLV